MATIKRILPCKCHAVSSDGMYWTKLVQFSKKGVMGIQTKKIKKWKKLNPVKTKSGYIQVNLHGKIIRLNRLIAFNFIANPTCLPFVCHINDNKLDNRASNLRWGTQKMNMADAEINGKRENTKGEKNYNAKLKESDIQSIIDFRKKGETLNGIAKRFSVSKKLILLIIQRKIWRHVCVN